jgi:hypothetical protein
MLSDKILKDVIVQWDEHDQFRDFEKRGEPVEVSLARDLLALRTALAALTEEATVRGQRAHNQGVILVCNHFAARIRELLEDRQ